MAKPDFSSFTEVPDHSIDQTVKDCAYLARIHPQDEDKHEMWSWSFVFFIAALAGLFDYLNHVRGNEYIFAIALIALVRGLYVKSRITEKFNRYVRMRDQLEQRIGQKLLFEIDR